MVERPRTKVDWTLVRHPVVVLAAVAALNATIYLLVFVRPWSLLALYHQPLLDLKRLSTHDPLARWRLLLGFALLSGLYCLGWRAALRARGGGAWALVLVGAFSSGAVLLFLYPFGAADIFDNIMHGRILGVHGANPFEQVAADFPDDPFLSYVAWDRFPSAYGPGWEMVAAATAWLAGDEIVANVLAFKILGGLFLAGCIGIVAILLRRESPERALAGTLLLAWNPLVLYETLGQGHNDAAMLFWILLAVWCLARKRYTLAVLALVVGALFKFIPLLLMPAVGLIALRALPDARARLRFALVTASLSILLMVLAYALVWHGPDTLGIQRRQVLFASSLPAVAYALLAQPLGKGAAASAVSLAAALLTALFALWQAIQASRALSWPSFVQAAFSILVFYLLCTCLWFQQWYLIWLVGLAPLLPQWRLAWLGAGLSLAVLVKPLIFEPLWLWPRPFPGRLWLELRLGPAVLGLPWLLALFTICKRWWRLPASDAN